MTPLLAFDGSGPDGTLIPGVPDRVAFFRPHGIGFDPTGRWLLAFGKKRRPQDLIGAIWQDDRAARDADDAALAHLFAGQRAFERCRRRSGGRDGLGGQHDEKRESQAVPCP